MFAFLIDSVCSLEEMCYVQIPGLGLVSSSFNPMESVSCIFFSWVGLDFFVSFFFLVILPPADFIRPISPAENVSTTRRFLSCFVCCLGFHSRGNRKKNKFRMKFSFALPLLVATYGWKRGRECFHPNKERNFLHFL